MLTITILTDILDEHRLLFSLVRDDVEIEGLVLLGCVAITKSPPGYRVEVDDELAATNPLAWKAIWPWSGQILYYPEEVHRFATAIGALNYAEQQNQQEG